MGKFERFDWVTDAIVRELASSMYTLGDIVAAEAHVSITRGSVSGKHHKPSNPGEPPMNDTGFLARQIEVKQTAPLKVEVSSNAPYAADLEFGTSKMAARPYMAPARDAKRAEVQKLGAMVVNRALRKFARR